MAVNYIRLLQTLHSISVECKDDAGAKSSGLRRRLQSFETFFGVRLALHVFEPAEECSKVLQTMTITAADAKKSALLTAHLLEGLRENFDDFYSKCVEEALSLGIDEPGVGRARKVPIRYDSSSSALYNPETAKQILKHMYFEFIDTAVSCIRQRYENPSYALLTQVESLLLHCANSNESIPDDDINAICTHFGDDLVHDELSRQLSVLQDVCTTSGSRIKNVAQIIEHMKKMGPSSMLLSEVCRLLQLYLVLSATVASAERTFSTLRRIKTYLRSTMTSERLNAVMVLVNKELTDCMDVKDVMKEFVVRTDVRKDAFGLVN